MQKQFSLPSQGYVGLKQFPSLGINIPRSTLWRWIAIGYFPKPLKLGPGVTAWSVDDIRSFLGANGQNSDHCWNDRDNLPYQGFISFDRFEKIGLSISIATVRRWANAGTFPKPVQLGPRKIAWRSADIWQFMNSHPATGWTPHGDKCNVVS